MPYNPFDKPIGSPLTKEDLQRLVEREVGENYFVEYKSLLPSKTKIAHSIASFANTYGGWYIVGVKTDPHNIAKEICGFSLKESPDPISKVRDIIKTHLDPIPIFHPQVVTLEEDKVVLLIHLPGDQETPFVAKDGRIYRRNHDSSDPVAETSRYTIDRLVDAGRDFAKRFERFCSDGRTFTEAEERQGWVNLYLSPSPLGTVEKSGWLLDTEIERLLQLGKTPFSLFEMEGITVTGTPAFNIGYPSYRSIVLK